MSKAKNYLKNVFEELEDLDIVVPNNLQILSLFHILWC